MKAVILAAGRGTRMGGLTDKKHKSLLPLAGKTIIEYTLLSLPLEIDSVVVVVKYLGDMIKREIGSEYAGIKIDYVEQKMDGTAGAVWSAKEKIGKGKLLVLNGDDLYSKKDISKCLSHETAMGLQEIILPSQNYLIIESDSSGFITGWHKPSREELGVKQKSAVGIYVIDERIFDYEPVVLLNGEYGLPQTILSMSRDIPVKGVLVDNWVQINTPEELIRAEECLKIKK